MSTDPTSLYFILVGAGFVLIAAEVVIPGGVLGVIGALVLVAAAILGFNVFGASGGLLSAIGLLFGAALFLALWFRYFPNSVFGQWFTLKEDGKDVKSFDDHLNALLHQTGVAHTDLRPSGIALIETKKIDVLSEAGFITKGTAVKVIEVTGNRVIVRPIESA